MESELSGFVYWGGEVRVRDPSLSGSVRAPVRACAPVEYLRRREAVLTFPGWRVERTQPLEVDCPLSRRRETAPAELHFPYLGLGEDACA